MAADMSPVVLLGAGASKEAGIPTSFELTERLIESVAAHPDRKTGKALHFVCGALLAHDASQGLSPFGRLDVERVFAAVRLLATRDVLDVTPFVSAWVPAVDEWDRPRLTRWDDEFLYVLAKGRRGLEPVKDPFERGALAHLHGHHNPLLARVVAAVNATVGKGTGEIYDELMMEMVRALRSTIGGRPNPVDYLAPLVQGGRCRGGLTVATLNYDLAIEQAGAVSGIPINTGVTTWNPGDWQWPDEGIRLLKLHGSINWCWQIEWGNGDFRHRAVRECGDREIELRPPALVFGHGEKLRAEGPFLALFAEFERQLWRTRWLIVVGYSFRDDHVNELIARWLAADAERRLTVVDPSFPEPPEERRSISSEELPDFRLRLNAYLNGEGPPSGDAFPPRLQVLRQPASEALQDLFRSAQAVVESRSGESAARESDSR